MTRGRIYLKTEKGVWIESTQLLYDMGYARLQDHGFEIISGFLHGQLDSKKELEAYLKRLFDKWNHNSPAENTYKLLYLNDNKEPVTISGLGDDYSYIMNSSSMDERIVLNGKEVLLKENEMIILFFTKPELRICRNNAEKMMLELNEDETNICIEALDFYNRIFIGQYSEIPFKLSCRLIDATSLYGKNKIAEHILMAIRGIVMKNAVLDNSGIDSSLGIWSEDTDIRAVNSYDMQQVMRYKLAYAKNPEGGYTVDFRRPMIKGNLPAFDCSCKEVNKTIVEELSLTGRHIQILNDALMVFGYLYRLQIRNLFEYFTDDCVALELASLLGKIYFHTKGDFTYAEIIDHVRKNVMFAGGSFIKL